ncbi:MAG: hypothetical protein ABEJ43_02575 [Haloferacaceae archaeon]
MDWQRERDGLVVVGVAALVLVLVGTGRGAGLAATFVATFLGVLAALRFDDWLDDSDDDAAGQPPTAAAASVETESPAEEAD